MRARLSKLARAAVPAAFRAPFFLAPRVTAS